MSQFRTYETLTPVVDFWTTVRKNNGNPDSGLDIRVGIFDSDTNTEQSFAMPEIGATGYYKYSWQPVLTQAKRYFITIYIASGGVTDPAGIRTVIDTLDIVINDNILNTQNKIDENDGQAI